MANFHSPNLWRPLLIAVVLLLSRAAIWTHGEASQPLFTHPWLEDGCGNFHGHCEIVRATAAFIGTPAEDLARIQPTRTWYGACGALPHREVSMQHLPLEPGYDWVRLIQSEFAEMPGLRLSKRQAQRLWNLDDSSAEAIFRELEASNVLRRMPNDVYIRADIRY